MTAPPPFVTTIASQSSKTQTYWTILIKRLSPIRYYSRDLHVPKLHLVQIASATLAERDFTPILIKRLLNYNEVKT